METQLPLEDEVISVTLQDVEGNSIECTVTDAFEHNGKKYAVVVANDEDPNDGFLLRVESDDEGDYLVEIETEEEWQDAVEAYNVLTTLDEA